jgi:hypothetical protein
MQKRSVYESSLIGVTGEYYVAAELCRRGCLALLTPRNYPRTDIIVYDSKTNRQITIQVKTTFIGSKAKKWSYMLSQEKDVLTHTEFFIFVAVLKADEPKYKVYILPGEKVAEISIRLHDEYLATHPNVKREQPYTMESEELKPYEDNWKILFQALST